MVDEKLNPETLLTSNWRELRTEVRGWDDDNDLAGFDCLTRYWCPEAVFEVYWVAELEECSAALPEQDVKNYSVYLTEDLQLAGFKLRLEYQPSMDWKRSLAAKLGWQERAKNILRELSDNQMDLF